nr:putative RNA-directed DNA polymerase, eukaryota, reverse transcriptase zinc-binding domain protein [Tanacetum cinerariifolium]
SKDLWNDYNKHGTVADVYIVRKLSKVGRRFAFVRFLKIENNESLINDLNKIWIGSYHLFAALARFDKNHNTTTKTNPKSSSKIIKEPVKNASFTAHTNPNHSYVNVLNGHGTINLASHPKNILKSVTLDESDLIDTSGIRNVLLAKVRDVNLIPNINIVLNNEGFYNFQCKYIGGMWLWIKFDTNEVCLKLQSNKEMSWYFTLLKHLHHSFILDERVAWIKIGGLLINAWTPKAFKKIVDSWGTSLFVDDDPNETVSTGRVCIKTKIRGQVNDNCKVVVLDKTYNAYVKEFVDWAPDIKATDTTSRSNLEMDNSDKHEDNLNDNSLLEKEEGEIPNRKDQDNFLTNRLHSPKVNTEAQKEDSNSISKPPGFEAFNSNVTKSQTKSFSNHGSMIEAFVSHIEMGKVLGYDIEGANKCKAIAKLCIKHKDSFLGIQETHFTNLDPFKVKCTWGNFQFEFMERPANGRSGGNWIASHIYCFMINVYAPQDDGKKETLWNEIIEFMNVNWGHRLIFGDFNVVRYASERLGHLFTRINKHGDKLSKLDRFLTLDSITPLLQKFSGHVLDCHISDHRPILLSPVFADFGPIPFKFYNSWLLDKNLHSNISNFWGNYAPTNYSQTREKEDLNKKIKDFDDTIATRYSDLSVDAQRSFWIDSLHAIELKENMDFSQKGKIKWGIEAEENSKFFHAIVNQKRRYLSIQGIKIEGHWIEDPLGIKDAFLTFYEKKFQKVKVVKIVKRSPFYKTLNIDQNTYLTSLVSETEIRDAIWDCGSDKSSGPDGFTFAFFKDFWNVIKSDVMKFVHHFFNKGILPRGCNTSFITLIPKVPSPMVINDFRPISLIGAQYKIITKVLANRLARVIDSVISHQQSAFIKHRQILDGPLMVNEVIQWCKRKKSKLMVFKIDFEKAFDTISWDFLLQVMHFMGFSESWIKWILGCLHSTSSSILINGSPTREFNIQRGLRQGDPLSPFLFIIAMEGLHVAMEDVIVAGLYKGFKINTFNISHLFFADDALFIGDWSKNNIKSLALILECFHQVSGLKINFHKSNLFGVGVPFNEVTVLASYAGCNALESPFSYLGLPIYCNMALVKR